VVGVHCEGAREVCHFKCRRGLRTGGNCSRGDNNGNKEVVMLTYEGVEMKERRKLRGG
jgi:hypothetical protein